MSSEGDSGADSGGKGTTGPAPALGPAKSVGYAPGTAPGQAGRSKDMGRTDIGAGPGSTRGESMAERTGISPENLADMVNAGMNPSNPVDVAIARAGIAMGLPPNPAKASQTAVMGGLLAPVSIATGVPMGKALDMVANPSMSKAVDFGLGLTGLGGLNSLQSMATGKTMGEMAFGSPTNTPGAQPSNSTPSSPTQNNSSYASADPFSRDDSGGNDFALLQPPKVNVPKAPTPQQAQPTGPLKLPDYVYQRQNWDGNNFLLAPIVRKA